MNIDKEIEKYNNLIKEIKVKTKKINYVYNLTNLIIIPLTIIVLHIVLQMKLPEIELGLEALLMGFAIVIVLLIIYIIFEEVTKKKGLFKNYNDQNELYYKIKNDLVVATLKKHFTNIEYDAKKGFSESFIQEEGMYTTGDIYSSEDYIEGKYKDKKFCQADINIQEEREEKDEDGNVKTYYVTTFSGRWLVFDFNKNFKSNLLIHSGQFGKKNIKYTMSGVEDKSIETDDSDFNKKFYILTANEHEAFYILTPHFMEKIKKVAEKFENCSIRLLFNNNKLHIGINGLSDSLEYTGIDEIDKDKFEERIDNDLKLIINLVDDLDLTNNLFKENIK